MPVIKDLSEASKKELLSEAVFTRLTILEKIAIRETILSTLFHYEEHTSSDLSCALQCILLGDDEIFKACYTAKDNLNYPLQESFIKTHKNTLAISCSALIFALMELGAYQASDLANTKTGLDVIWNMFIFEFPLIITPLTYHLSNYYLGKQKPNNAIEMRAKSCAEALFFKLSDKLGNETASALVEELKSSAAFALISKYQVKDSSIEAQHEKTSLCLAVMLTWIKEVDSNDPSIINIFDNIPDPSKQAPSVINRLGLFRSREAIQVQESPQPNLRRRQPFQDAMNRV